MREYDFIYSQKCRALNTTTFFSHLAVLLGRKLPATSNLVINSKPPFGRSRGLTATELGTRITQKFALVGRDLTFLEKKIARKIKVGKKHPCA